MVGNINHMKSVEEDISMEVRERITEILVSVLGRSDVAKDLEKNDNLTKLGINSMSFVKLIVMLELEFGLEFDDEILDIGRFQKFSQLCSYIEEIHK